MGDPIHLYLPDVGVRLCTLFVLKTIEGRLDAISETLAEMQESIQELQAAIEVHDTKPEWWERDNGKAK